MTVEAFFLAADFAMEVVERPEVATDWGKPSLVEGYSVGGIVGHMASVLARTETLILEPEPKKVNWLGPEIFYGDSRICDSEDLKSGLPAFLLADGERRALAGHSNVVESMKRSLAELNVQVEKIPKTKLVPLVAFRNGATDVQTYLETRCVELVVHVDDVVTSIGLESMYHKLPKKVGDVVIRVLTCVSRTMVDDINVIRAFTRPERVPPNHIRIF